MASDLLLINDLIAKKPVSSKPLISQGEYKDLNLKPANEAKTECENFDNLLINNKKYTKDYSIIHYSGDSASDSINQNNNNKNNYKKKVTLKNNKINIYKRFIKDNNKKNKDKTEQLVLDKLNKDKRIEKNLFNNFDFLKEKFKKISFDESEFKERLKIFNNFNELKDISPKKDLYLNNIKSNFYHSNLDKIKSNEASRKGLFVIDKKTKPIITNKNVKAIFSVNNMVQKLNKDEDNNYSDTNLKSNICKENKEDQIEKSNLNKNLATKDCFDLNNHIDLNDLFGIDYNSIYLKNYANYDEKKDQPNNNINQSSNFPLQNIAKAPEFIEDTNINLKNTENNKLNFDKNNEDNDNDNLNKVKNVTYPSGESIIHEIANKQQINLFNEDKTTSINYINSNDINYVEENKIDNLPFYSNDFINFNEFQEQKPSHEAENDDFNNSSYQRFNFKDFLKDNYNNKLFMDFIMQTQNLTSFTSNNSNVQNKYIFPIEVKANSNFITDQNFCVNNNNNELNAKNNFEGIPNSNNSFNGENNGRNGLNGLNIYRQFDDQNYDFKYNINNEFFPKSDKFNNNFNHHFDNNLKSFDYNNYGNNIYSNNLLKGNHFNFNNNTFNFNYYTLQNTNANGDIKNYADTYNVNYQNNVNENMNNTKPFYNYQCDYSNFYYDNNYNNNNINNYTNDVFQASKRNNMNFDNFDKFNREN